MTEWNSSNSIFKVRGRRLRLGRETLFSTSSGSRIGTWAKRIIPNSRRRLWRREGSGLSTFAASQFSFWHLRGWELAADALLIANHARDSYREQGLKDETPPANLSSTLPRTRRQNTTNGHVYTDLLRAE
ncbi:hypothetical protein PABG_11404 [Paracoccidioides brasiliensis Pb03]|nr:hypothetical protein PABG_11404 [Paracoccidioides brasiliensis Pb03]